MSISIRRLGVRPTIGASLAAALTLVAIHGARPAPAERIAPQRAALAIRAGRILDPRSGRYSPSSVVLVSGGRIASIVPATQYRPAMADSTIDLGNATLLPGLIDAHVHLAIGGPANANALADLRAGFTTIVDMGARTHRLLQIRDSINAGSIEGPRVLAAGIWVGTKGGVCEFAGIGIDGGPDRFVARVRGNASAGAEVTKLCLSGWPADAFARPTDHEMSPDVLAATVAEAHRLGRRAVAHAISLGSVRAALDAGVDGIVHAAYLDSATAVRLRERKVFMIPTLVSLTAGDTSRVSRALVESVTLAHRLGVTMVFGTDAGVLPHGRNAEEFQAMIHAGVDPLTAIRSATTDAAQAFGLADSVGVVAPGMVADLIAVDGDPVADPRALAAPPRLVISRGRVVRR